MIIKIAQYINKFEHQFPAKVLTKQQIKYIRSLHQKKFRDEYNCYVAEGQRIINETILNQPTLIELIICTPKAKKQLKVQSIKNSFKFIEVSGKEFSRISGQKTPQEALAVIRKNKLKYSLDDIADNLVLAYDHLQDPGNFGTILRLADWFGIKDILCSDDCVDLYNPKVIQSSMGAFLRVNVHYGKLRDMLNSLREEKSYTILTTSLNGNNFYEEEYSGKNIIIFGNEAGGISESINAIADRKIMIPNYSKKNEKTESLNVSVAAAIICSEMRRRG